MSTTASELAAAILDACPKKQTPPPTCKTDRGALLRALHRNGIEASPRTLATWLETADKLCMALANYYQTTEPQAVRSIAALEDAAHEFRLIDL